jgi:prepilin signal peptidase PulO-like enzyme (type II secretory pathway)
MSLLTGIILALFGLAIGSFLNVFLLRYRPDTDSFFSLRRTGGRSACPHCGEILSWMELVPLLSFIVQWGRCRKCHKKISWQYPLVELASAAIMVGVPLFLRHFFMYWNPSWEGAFVLVSAFWIVALLSLIMAFVIDVRHFIIPNALNFSIFVMGLLWTGIGWGLGLFEHSFGGSFIKHYREFFFSFHDVWLDHLLGMVIAAVFFFAIVLLSKGRAMGMGDVKLIGALGLLFGWPDIVLVMFLAFLIGAVWAVLLMVLGKKKMSDKVPFGPFIVIAASLVFFLGTSILSGYFGILGV